MSKFIATEILPIGHFILHFTSLPDTPLCFWPFFFIENVVYVVPTPLVSGPGQRSLCPLWIFICLLQCVRGTWVNICWVCEAGVSEP